MNVSGSFSPSPSPSGRIYFRRLSLSLSFCLPHSLSLSVFLPPSLSLSTRQLVTSSDRKDLLFGATTHSSSEGNHIGAHTHACTRTYTNKGQKQCLLMLHIPNPHPDTLSCQAANQRPSLVLNLLFADRHFSTTPNLNYSGSKWRPVREVVLCFMNPGIQVGYLGNQGL